MKKLFALALVVLGLAACQTDHSDLDVQFDGNATITLSIPADAVTRAGGSNSAASGLDNTEGEKLRFILAIYDETGAEKIRETQYANEGTLTANFPVRLVPGRSYTFVAWADMVTTMDENNNYVDNHYNTSNLENITLNVNSEWNAMDETRDAFTAKHYVASYAGTSTLDMKLTRPFAKLRVIATDVADIARLGLTATHAKVAYTVPVATSYNAFEQKVAGTESVNHEYEIAAYTANNNETTQVLYTDYIFANDEQGAVKFTLTTYEDAEYNKQIREVNFNTDIPVKRNMLTTLTGNVMTEGNNVSVEVKPVFPVEGGKHDITAISSYQDLLTAIEQGGEYLVINDITVNVGASTQSLAATRTGEAATEESTEGSTPATTGKTTTINLNGFTITVNNNSATAAAAITIPAGDTLVIAGNGSIELTEGSTGAVFNNNEGEVIIAGGEFEDNATDTNANIFTNEENVKDIVAELEEKFTNGGEYTLVADVTLNKSLTLAAGKTLTLDLDDKTIRGTDNESKSYGMFNIEPGAKLTIEGGNGKIQLTATKNRGWDAYSSVISNQRGEFVLNGGTIEHLGGTDMAYGIDNLTNTGAGDAKTTINGGVVKSPYRAVRLFLNSTKALDEVIVNGGTIEGGNKSIWVQNANANVNPGKLVVTESANLMGDVMVSGANAPELAIELSVAEAALKNGATVIPSKIPAGYDIYVKNGYWVVEKGVEIVDNEVSICNAAGLKWIAQQVNNGADYFAGKTVKLTADIDLKGEEWTPIGSAYKDHGFMGNFNGNGFIIKNLAIKDITPDGDGYVYGGLFGVTEGVDTNNQNYIKNLVIENVDIDLDGHIVAAAIAYPYYTEIENVTVKGNISIKGGNYTSGVLAYTRRCIDAKNISIVGDEGSVIDGDQTIGGVISDIQMNGGLTANYSNFKASGLTIKGVKCVGGISGIIGRQTLDGATVENVTIVCDDVRKGQISGASDGDCCINNVTVNNIAGATFFVGSIYENGENNHTSVTINGVTYEYNNGWFIVPVAKIGETEYATLQEAFNVGGDITLLRNVAVAETVVLAEGKTVVLDLNGKTLSATDMNTIKNNGGVLTIKNGTVTRTGDAVGYSVNNASGEIAVENATIERGLYTSGSKMTATNANISHEQSSRHAIYAWNCEVTINSGTFHNDNAGNATLMASGSSAVTINGGTFSIADGRSTLGWTSSMIDQNSTAQVIVKGGLFNGGFRINSADTTLTIEGGEFNTNNGSAFTDYSGTKVVKGGKFTDAGAQNWAKKYIAEGYEMNANGEVVAK